MIKEIKKVWSIVICILIFTSIFIGVGTVANADGCIKSSEYWKGEARTFVSGYITEDTTWYKENSPYIVKNDVIVDKGVTLTIEPGVIVKFYSYCDLYVDGFLSAVGSKTDQIVFTSIKDDAVGGDTNGDGSATRPEWGDWKYIKFRLNGNGNIQNSTIKYGFGIYCEYSSPIITNNSIIECLTGIFCKYSSPTITDNRITNAPANGIFCLKSSPAIEDNIIMNNHHGIFCAGSSPKIIGNIISYNINGVKTEGLGAKGVKSSPVIIENMISYNENGINCSYNSNPIIIGNSIENNNRYGIYCYQDSSPVIINNNIINNGNRTKPVICTSISITNTVSQTNAGIICSEFSISQIDHNCISFNQIGILCYPQSNVNISSNRIENNDIGIISIQTSPIVNYNNITGNQVGLALYNDFRIAEEGITPSINWNNIYSNAEYGMVNFVDEESPVIVNAIYNWWGSPQGPFHESNPNGGDKVSDYIEFRPWLEEPYC